MSIKVQSNAKDVFDRLQKKVDNALSPKQIDALMRELAVTTAGTMRERIHEKGLDANGSAIGQYSLSYMKLRDKRGRTEGRKVVLSFNRDMEGDFTLGKSNPEPTKLPNGYGVGWLTDLSAEKATYLELRYKKKIFKMTNKERSDALKIVQEFSNRQIGKI